MESQTTPPPISATVICSNCGTTVSTSDAITLHNSPVCAACKPVVLQRLKEGGIALHTGLWRDEKLLVVALTESTVYRREATLPDRCVKCNAPAHGYRLSRKLQWHPPGYYAVILLNVIIYAIVANAVSKRAKIEVGLCADHRRMRFRDLLIAWGLFAAASCSFVTASLALPTASITVGALCLIASMVYGFTKGRVVSPKRIDDDHAWLRGVCTQYLDTLPPWK
jgi:hypothetical protein